MSQSYCIVLHHLGHVTDSPSAPLLMPLLTSPYNHLSSSFHWPHHLSTPPLSPSLSQSCIHLQRPSPLHSVTLVSCPHPPSSLVSLFIHLRCSSYSHLLFKSTFVAHLTSTQPASSPVYIHHHSPLSSSLVFILFFTSSLLFTTIFVSLFHVNTDTPLPLPFCQFSFSLNHLLYKRFIY